MTTIEKWDLVKTTIKARIKAIINTQDMLLQLIIIICRQGGPMKMLLNTFKLCDKRYLIKKDTIDISDYNADQVARMIRLIEHNGRVWEYQKVEEKKAINPYLLTGIELAKTEEARKRGNHY